jgi:hypothetical protein
VQPIDARLDVDAAQFTPVTTRRKKRAVVGLRDSNKPEMIARLRWHRRANPIHA